ncbi:MAG: hypothetical protein AAGC74_00835 [Verrucomicrobiota bacterium]
MSWRWDWILLGSAIAMSGLGWLVRKRVGILNELGVETDLDGETVALIFYGVGSLLSFFLLARWAKRFGKGEP